MLKEQGAWLPGFNDGLVGMAGQVGANAHFQYPAAGLRGQINASLPVAREGDIQGTREYLDLRKSAWIHLACLIH
jgi:hypothetical protein